MDSRVEIRDALEEARARTLELLEPVSAADLITEISPLQSPLVWDFAHVAHFEELWLLRNMAGEAPLVESHDDLYEAFRHERAGDTELPILRPSPVYAYAADVRERVLELVEHLELDAPNPLLRRGFVFRLVLQNELRHQETMLQTLALRTEGEYPHSDEPPPDQAPGGPEEVSVSAGVFGLGAVDDPWAYDNELDAHEVELDAFFIDRVPVTNGDFAEFVADRGYRAKALWDSSGWVWRRREGIEAPLHWERTSDGWERMRFGRREPVTLDEPVQHVSWYEADAFARWAGKRLPTEAEWERAAGWHQRVGKFRYPWGGVWTGFEANLGHRRFSPAPAGSYSGGVSPSDCVQMAGDVWEWTSSTFEPYPGFLPFPYPEYSEVFFGEEYRVLRGGSWATAAVVARTTFRNWELPVRRQIFAGFRCARDKR